MKHSTTQDAGDQAKTTSRQSSRKRPRPSLRAKLILAGFGLLVGLLCAEIAVFTHQHWWLESFPSKEFKRPADDAADLTMAVLGGSTADGTPFRDVMNAGRDESFNLLSVSEYFLEDRYAIPDVQVDNYSGPNWSAETSINHYWEVRGCQPDVLILYTGQNETTRYYSPNMRPPSAVLSVLAPLNTGDLLLRHLFNRQLRPDDHQYEGAFFSDAVIPTYERQYNLNRFANFVERIIRHCQQEGIFLLVVIPESNYLFPPTRSIYDGPASRKPEALRLFKEAFHCKYFLGDAERAHSIFEKISQFCSFADLSYELGEYHHAHGDHEMAVDHLRRARDTDGFPVAITSQYRERLRYLVDRHVVQYIDMKELLARQFGKPTPDYTSFVDECHLRREVYVELSREIVHHLGDGLSKKLTIPEQSLAIGDEQWSVDLGITPEISNKALSWEAKYHIESAGYSFLKLRRLLTALEYLESAPENSEISVAELEAKIDAERQRLLKWIGTDIAQKRVTVDG